MMIARIAHEITTHHDAEMSWIVDESRAMIYADGARLSRGELVKKIGGVIGEVMISRLGDLGSRIVPLSVREFESAAWESLTTMEHKPDHCAEDTIAHLLPACIAYACLRKMGLLLGRQDPTPGADYWPFGQEGGFCNPMKLKLMREDD